MGKSPEEVEEWSYGNAPMHVPQMIRLPQVKQGRKQQLADTVLLGADVSPLAAASARTVRAIPKALQHGAEQFALAQFPSRVVKSKGGNWLTGSVEDALKGLKKNALSPEDALLAQQRIDDALARGAVTPDYVAGARNRLAGDSRNAALNSWIDKQLTRYVKNEMATPEDPIRALAERGIHHNPFQEGSRWVPEEIGRRRGWTKNPEEGVAVSDLAKQWEDAADYMVEPYSAGEVARSSMAIDNPWISKVDPATPVFRAERDMARYGELGFPHLIDELSNALNPQSGLPAHLQLPADRLNKVSVPQAVERVSQINAWRAAQKAEADAKRANNAATHLFKEYPDQGYRWVELKANPKTDELGNVVNKGDRDLADALKYEGDTMQHCVGGYCDDVLSGKTKIYSLRDAKGQPHVTVEVEPGRKLTEADLPDDVRDQLANFDGPQHEFEAMVQKALAEQSIGDRIAQIKGKQNTKPKDEYLPFVQDFVRSGKWSDVRDLQNTGLMRHPVSGDFMTEAEYQAAKEAAETSRKEIGFAGGGKVSDKQTATSGIRGFTFDIDELERQLS
jgi:hypothetical protein